MEEKAEAARPPLPLVTVHVRAVQRGGGVRGGGAVEKEIQSRTRIRPRPPPVSSVQPRASPAARSRASRFRSCSSQAQHRLQTSPPVSSS